MVDPTPPPPGPISRRSFIEGLGFATGGAAVGIAIGLGIPSLTDDGGAAGSAPAIVTAYPRVKIATLSSLTVGKVVDFNYPTEKSPASLFRLGRPAAGGIGPDRDIVAFATDCTHMGCPLRGMFKADHAILGPCVCHFTTFDLTLRGMVVLGQATENLPQIVLDLVGDDIIAVGTLGLVYGFRDNLADAPLVKGL